MSSEEIGKYLEKFDYEYYLNEALSRVPSEIDTREGSVIYDALAPACYQLAEVIMILKNNILLETYTQTATGQYLNYRAEETGIYRIKATQAIVRAKLTKEDEQPFEVAIGSRFSSIDEEPIYYTVISGDKETGTYLLKAESAGILGNQYIGRLLPLDNFNGLAEAVLTEVVIPARDEETDDELRIRTLKSREIVSFGGNIEDYIGLTMSQNGVGAVQVYPVWQGGGTVRLVILNNKYEVASDELISQVQESIDPTQDGQGIGYAPIGHKVTVATPNKKIIDVSFNLSLNEGLTQEQIKEKLEQAIENYFDTVRKKWADRKNASYDCWIYRSQITAAILSVQGVDNIENVKLNNLDKDVQMILNNDKQEIPVLGKVVLA